MLQGCSLNMVYDCSYLDSINPKHVGKAWWGIKCVYVLKVQRDWGEQSECCVVLGDFGQLYERGEDTVHEVCFWENPPPSRSCWYLTEVSDYEFQQGESQHTSPLGTVLVFKTNSCWQLLNPCVLAKVIWPKHSPANSPFESLSNRVNSSWKGEPWELALEPHAIIYKLLVCGLQ